jgi:hypothetical protein
LPTGSDDEVERAAGVLADAIAPGILVTRSGTGSTDRYR